MLIDAEYLIIVMIIKLIAKSEQKVNLLIVRLIEVDNKTTTLNCEKYVHRLTTYDMYT